MTWPTHPNSPWPHRDDELTAHWHAGTPTAEIGRRMNLSKNAIVGRAHRLNLPERPSPIKGRRDPSLPPPAYLPKPKPPTLSRLMAEQAVKHEKDDPAPEKVPVATKPLQGAAGLAVARARAAEAVAPVEIAKPVAPSLVAAVAPTEREGCRFPMWPHNVRAPQPPLFCDAPKRLGISYCPEHAKLCFTAAGARMWGQNA